MTRLRMLGWGMAAVMTVAPLVNPASSATASTASPATVKLTLTGLNRDSRTVSVPEASMLRIPDGLEEFYQGTPLAIPAGTYLIGGEVPAYSGGNLVSQTLVFRKVTIGRSETVRLDGRDGQPLRVTLAGAQATPQDLSADVCMSATANAEGVLAGGASAGTGVTVYAVPTSSSYITFDYSDILTSASGATYYLIGSHRGAIPSHLTYTQQASGLAKLTMALRSGAYGSSQFDWSILSGTSQTFCGAGQSTNTFSVQKWVNYLTPGPWTTSVTAYSQGRDSNFYRNAYFFTTRTFRAGRSYTSTFGGAVAGPGPVFPETSAHYPSTYTRLSYTPDLFYGAGTTGGQICCDRSVVTLRLGSHTVKTASLGTNGVFGVSIRKSGWYTLDAQSRRWFEDGGTPSGLLSPRVAVSFRFHASAVPAGNGAQQNLPLTDTRYRALSLNSANQAPADGVTKLDITITRPANAGVASPVYRLKSVTVFASLDGGMTWHPLKIRRIGGHWLASIADPASGYVAIRSIVTDVHGDRTEQTVYRAYRIAH
jgi:hypothetical protein